MTRHIPPRKGITLPKGTVAMDELFFDHKGRPVDKPAPGGKIEWTFYADVEGDEILWSEHFDVR